jgi:hypothetical protein
MTDPTNDYAHGGPTSPDLAAAWTVIAAATDTPSSTTATSVAELLRALEALHWMQTRLTQIEPALILAARTAGASWQTLAPALGVASRQAAERRYLRLATSPALADGGPPDTREDRVRAERDRRAGHRAVNLWANDNTAGLRSLAGQISALTDLTPAADADIDRLHQALADPDATALPGLLTAARPHLHAHPLLTAQIDTITERADQIRRDTARRRAAGTDPTGT